MTATVTPPASGSAARRPSDEAAARGGSPRDPQALLGVRRTLLALLAGALGMIPLKGLFSDYGWLIDVWFTMIVVIAPAAFLRRRRPPGALDIWPGIVLLVPWLTLRFVREHALLGFIPTGRTWHDVSLLLTQLHHTTRSEVAPIHTTIAVRLVVCALLGLLTALIDLIAVVGRRGALAGVPLLIVYTVAGAVPRHPVSWVWFAFAAVGYLILLGLDAGDDLQNWGRRIRAPRASRSTNGMSVSTPRIAAAAVVLAIVLPLVIPGQSRNLIANAFHDGGNRGIGGFGGGGGGSISPFAALKGQLDRPNAVPMASVHLINPGKELPFYLRVNVLEKYTGAEWTLDSHGNSEGIDTTGFDTEPANATGVSTASMQARITVLGLTGNAPVFAVPTDIQGLSSDTTWSTKDQILLGADVTRGTQYTEQFTQPEPTRNQLNAATGRPGAELAPMLALPSDFPSYVTDLVSQLTAGLSTPYQRALAISNYFTDPKNGFQYDLKTDPGDSGSVLVDFLKHKRGYCQQYAASMGVMLRSAGIPSRVVLGYMHSVPDDNNDFTVTTSEAHAWVEAYFSGIGWVPFDPTPAAGLVGGARTDLAWAPHNYPSGRGEKTQPNDVPTTKVTAPQRRDTQTQPTTATPQAAAQQDSSMAPLWWLLGGLLVVLLVLMPAMIRAQRRRRRYAAARRDGNADALWAELSDTATDLGYVWSPARSPRQVAAWLAGDAAGSSAELQALAVAVEHGRYSPAGGPGGASDADSLADSLRSVTGQLTVRRSRTTRFRARFWPASLGWTSTPVLAGIG